MNLDMNFSQRCVVDSLSLPWQTAGLPLSLSGYRLFLRFNNGEAGEVDLSGELDSEMFEALRDLSLIATDFQHSVMRTMAWANGADLAPEFLFDLMQNAGQQAASRAGGALPRGRWNLLRPEAARRWIPN